MVPIIAYNYGAGKRERLIKTMKLSIAYAVGIMTVGLLVFQLFPARLFALFEASDTMLAIGVPALRIISLSFLFAGFCIVTGYSMLVSIARQLLVLLPVAYLLSRMGNINYVWLAFPIAELVSVSMTVFFLIRINRKVIRYIGEEQEER